MNEKKDGKIQRILVTGGTGFLGSRICQYFSAHAGSQVLSPTHTQLDITDQENVRNYFMENQPDILIHCAAISDVGKCDEDVEKSYAINVTGVENLAKACGVNKTRMIFCSSDQVYFSKNQREEKEGGKNQNETITDRESMPMPHKESESVQPCNTYGRQKLEAEEKALTICSDAVCLRLSWMYDTKKVMEQEHGNFYANVNATLARGEICRFPVHDLRGITYTGAVIENLPKVFQLPGGVYNYGAENALCTYELVKRLFEKKGIPTSSVEPNEQAFLENPRNISMDISKIRKYGIEFHNTLENLIQNWQ